MAVKLRLVRVGKRNHPAYRICAMDSRKARDGLHLEIIGSYDPFVADDNKKVRLRKDRAEYWLSRGAQPSETVLSFLKKEKVAGLIRSRPKRKRRRKPAAPAAPKGTAARKPPKKARKPKPPKKPKAPKES